MTMANIACLRFIVICTVRGKLRGTACSGNGSWTWWWMDERTSHLFDVDSERQVLAFIFRSFETLTQNPRRTLLDTECGQITMPTFQWNVPWQEMRFPPHCKINLSRDESEERHQCFMREDRCHVIWHIQTSPRIFTSACCQKHKPWTAQWKTVKCEMFERDWVLSHRMCLLRWTFQNDCNLFV